MAITLRHVFLAQLVALLVAPPLAAFERLEGCFVAELACPALSSIRKSTNPGDVQTEVAREYELRGANKTEATHFQIRIPGASPPDRWVEAGCGQAVLTCEGVTTGNGGGRGPIGEGAPSFADNLLAVSWQPAFCELKEASKPECLNQEGRFDADHFALHGLWPQPRNRVYCGVGLAERRADWDDLPALELSVATRAELDRVMPGTQSFLHRHEWTKHGTCYSHAPEEYYLEALQLMAALNASPAQALFADQIGEEVTAREIRAAFDAAFGEDAGDRVEVVCSGDGGVTLISELRIALIGEITEDTTLADLIHAADPVDRGCRVGLVDPAGFQL